MRVRRVRLFVDAVRVSVGSLLGMLIMIFLELSCCLSLHHVGIPL